MRGLAFFQFGQYRGFVNLKDFFEMAKDHKTAWAYKNGKARYYLADIDHGTNRIQMEGIEKAYYI